MQNSRPPAPSEVKRQLRQESGFGCCFCGHPFIQYHHIVPWAEDNHFRVEDMMVACGQCHHLLTVGAIPVDDQRKAKAKPKNIVDGHVKGNLYVTSKELTVQIAGGTAKETPVLLRVSGENVLSARLSKEDGRVLVSAIISDSSGERIATLTDNEWEMKPGAVWDFEVYPRSATIRTSRGDIAFGVDARNDMVAMQGKWYCNGQPLIFTPQSALARGNTMSGIIGAYNGTHIGVS